MENGWVGSASSRRRSIPQCVVNQRATFSVNPGLRGRCSDLNNRDCLCSQRSQDANQMPFYGFFLTRICTDCPPAELEGKDPLAYLADECPDIASELEGRYTCIPGVTTFPNLSPTSSDEETIPSSTSSPFALPTGNVPLRTSTVRFISPSSTNSPFLVSTASIEQSASVSQATTSIVLQTPAISGTREKSGLSTGAVAGIAIAVAVPVILFIIAAVFFCWRRKSHKNKSWQAERSSSPELYTEGGAETAYGAQMNVKRKSHQTLSPIMQEKQRGSAHIIETREIYENEEAVDSTAGLYRNRGSQENTRDVSRTTEEKFVAVQASAGYKQQHSRGRPGTKSASGVITRKEVPSRNSVPAMPTSRVYSPPPLSHETQQRQESRSSSRISSTLRGPVPDMYAYAGVTIENEEELERLEEEERRIDEAIRESESRAQMRVEKEDVKTKIQSLRS